MADYGQSASSLAMSMAQQGATPDEINTALSQHVKGDLPERANITKAIVEGYTDGLLIAGAWYLGPAASVGKVIGGGIIAEIANGSYQWFDLSRPGNENKSWDWKSSVSSGISGMLAPGRTVQQNVGIAVGGAVFTDGPDMGSVGGAALGAWAGGKFGGLAPGAVGKITGANHIPEFIYDVIGAGGSEVVGGFTKDMIKASQESKLNSKDTKND
ncbi:filamentous hemagglutinin [Rosenbergiella nectarea]|uniref:Filamentous hemagglutinin n=2 Tax=Rosenbergiella nectarea TaxID=988801 RepID=A0A1H9MER3_9GAMM|nr:filamentous hemagglutinin [Rosenbergiella nectarea]